MERVKRKPLDMTPVCVKCGKPAPVDTELSTENWTVFKEKEPCQCGGEYKPQFLIEAALSERGDDGPHD